MTHTQRDDDDVRTVRKWCVTRKSSLLYKCGPLRWESLWLFFAKRANFLSKDGGEERSDGWFPRRARERAVVFARRGSDLDASATSRETLACDDLCDASDRFEAAKMVMFLGGLVLMMRVHHRFFSRGIGDGGRATCSRWIGRRSLSVLPGDWKDLDSFLFRKVTSLTRTTLLFYLL